MSAALQYGEHQFEGCLNSAALCWAELVYPHAARLATVLIPVELDAPLSRHCQLPHDGPEVLPARSAFTGPSLSVVAPARYGAVENTGTPSGGSPLAGRIHLGDGLPDLERPVKDRRKCDGLSKA